MLFVTLFLLTVCVFLVGVGIVLAAVGAICLAVLIGVGIVSTSTLTGLLRGRFSSGLRALHYQCCVAVGVPAGMGVGLAASFLQDGLPLASLLLLGALGGAAAGLALACAGSYAVALLGRRVRNG